MASEIKVDSIVNSSGDEDSGFDLSTNDVVKAKTANSERMRIDSSGNVLVGKTSTGDFVTGFEVQPAGAVVLYRSSGVAGLFGRTDNGEILRFNVNSATVGHIDSSSGNLLIRTDGNKSGIRFDTNGLTAFKNNSEADNTVDLGYSSGRFKDLYLGGGVYVGGTGSANHLDDYEEGTFTPTLSGDTGGTGTLSNGIGGSATGRYTKIGRFVHCELTFVIDNTGNISGRVIIGGFPFTCGFFGGQGAVRNQGFGGSNTDGIVMEMNQGAATGRFHFNSSSSAQRSVFASDVSNGDFVGAGISYST